MIARVEPLVTARAVRGPFDYRIPERLAGIEVGSVLLVPFGPQRLLGIVVDVAETSEIAPDRLAEPIRALEQGVPHELVRLAQWIALEYCTTPARALELVVPPGTRRGGAEARPKLETLVSPTAEAAAALDGATRLGERQRAVLEALRGRDEVAAAELAVDRGVLRRLEQRGLVGLVERERSRRPRGSTVAAPSEPASLSPEQAAVVERVEAALAGGREDRELLLHGVTGSGKTEVYLAASRAALDRGLGVIALVPEIALTPQTMARFSQRFGDRVAILHSKLSIGERRDEWMRLRRGEARIAVGPRSAIFAPVAELGLIVIDEEHEPSYKQESDPRYDAREVALRRARAAGALLVAGSATPRPESWHEMTRVELTSRIDGAPLPGVEVLDMRGRPGSAGPLHPQTASALGSLAAERGKAIVLLNRRGWSVHLACAECGHAWQCPDCDVSLVVHRGPGRLVCHHCGHGEPLPRSCTECGSVSLTRSGTGTEQLEQHVRAAAGGAEVLRLDADSAARRGELDRILARFAGAESAVLIGTQMVAKGHDFPDVTLAVVVDADATLRFPDFRSEERTFSLVTQLAGRSGRGERPGRVLVQTLAPSASAITFAARHDSAGFVAAEIERRRELDYPPFTTLIRVEAQAEEERAAHEAAAGLAKEIAERLPSDATMLGPAPRFRLRGRHRRHLVVKAAAREPAILAVRAGVEAAVRAGRTKGTQLAVDVDPQ